MLLLVVFITAFGLAALTTPVAIRLGQRWGLVDRPGGRRTHLGDIPRIGGLGLFAGFFVTALGLFLLVPLPVDNQRLPLFGVLLGTLFTFLFGLADDKFQFTARPQLIAQIVAALIAVATTVFIEQVTLPIIGLVDFKAVRWLITYPLTIVWIILMMNTVNLLDGLDGLATGVGGIAALLFAFHSYQLGQTEIALYALALAGACAGFLLFNFNPARIFLGSAGAMVLGFALATLSILAPARVATALLVMALPIIDAVFQFFDRLRRGHSPGQGDRGHLHYRLFDLGFSQRQIVLGYWLFCTIFGMLALLISSRIYKVVALGFTGVLVLVVLVILSRRQPPPE